MNNTATPLKRIIFFANGTVTNALYIGLPCCFVPASILHWLTINKVTQSFYFVFINSST